MALGQERTVLSPYFSFYLRNIEQKTPFVQRNVMKAKGFAVRSWMIGKYGFKMGACVGSCVGFGVGVVQALKIKNVWPIPMAVVGSGFVFGTMFAFSSVLKASPINNDDHQYSH